MLFYCFNFKWKQEWSFLPILSSITEYEIAFDELADGREGITYKELSLFFEILSLGPTRAEIRFAVDKILDANSDEYLSFVYTKEIVVDIALHIFVPKGTHMENSRKSTWLCPLVGNDDAALRFGDNYKKISLGMHTTIFFYFFSFLFSSKYCISFWYIVYAFIFFSSLFQTLHYSVHYITVLLILLNWKIKSFNIYDNNTIRFEVTKKMTMCIHLF